MKQPKLPPKKLVEKQQVHLLLLIWFKPSWPPGQNPMKTINSKSCHPNHFETPHLETIPKPNSKDIQCPSSRCPIIATLAMPRNMEKVFVLTCRKWKLILPVRCQCEEKPKKVVIKMAMEGHSNIQPFPCLE